VKLGKYREDIVGASAIYQRTDAGRMEIQLKKQGLTQSERLLLIVVDGRAPLSELGEKLKVLEGNRVIRAVEKLACKHLIYEVLMVSAVPKADAFDTEVVDRFLQQDPLDPVTIVSFDDEYDYEDLESGDESVPLTISSNSIETTELKVSAINSPASLSAGPSELAPVLPSNSGVDFFISAEEIVVQEKVSGGTRHSQSSFQSVVPPLQRVVHDLNQRTRGVITQSLWGGLLVLGLILLVVSVYGN
jgi:hypothetical protein